MPDPTGFEYDVFISYSSRDKDWVRGELVRRVEEVGLLAFIDFRDFKRGAASIKEMERGITNCRKTLIVLTPSYVESEWCEIETVMLQTLSPANRDLRLIPLLKTSCDKPLHIGALTHIDFTDSADFDLAWQQLLSSLEALPECSDEKAVPSEIQTELDAAKNFMEGDRHAEAVPILERALAVADRANHPIARVKVRLSLAHALYDSRDDFRSAEQHYRDARALVPVNNRDLKLRVLHGLGEMLLFAGRIDEARASISAMVALAQQAARKDELAWSLILESHLEQDLGLHLSAVTKLDDAIQILLQRALSISDDEAKQNASALAICYLNKAVIFRENGNIDDAFAQYKKAENQHRASGDKLDAGKALLFCGEMHCANADWDRGFQSFRSAMGLFSEISNPLWMARAAGHMSHLYATHERWEEALDAMLAAVSGAAESGHPGEQVHFLCLAAGLLRSWKLHMAKDGLLRQAKRLAKDLPEDKQSEFYAAWTNRMGEMTADVEKAVQADSEVHDLLSQAKQIAEREHLPRHLANCLLEEAYQLNQEDDAEARRELVTRAVELLTEDLRNAQAPRVRGQLIGRISALYGELGDSAEAMSWLRRAGEIFEKSGDVHGLAGFYGALGKFQRARGELGAEIASYRKALSLIEGRSFHDLAAGIRIDLANALGFSREFSEAQRLLNEAEQICDRYQFKDMRSAIGRCRNKIERKVQAAQAPTQTLPQLLDSLNQLLQYRPEHAAAYLPFWYFAFQSELLTAVRSGPSLSLMVVSNDVDRFMKFAGDFHHLADHFLMATSTQPTVTIEPSILSIPPTWLFPPTFTFVGTRKRSVESRTAEEKANAEQDDDAPPRICFTGPATAMPLYTFIKGKTNLEGEGQVMALSAPSLPQEAIDLMVHRPIDELIARRAVWLPSPRHSSIDRFLTDLRIGHERGFFPVYVESVPTSNAVTLCSAVQITVPQEVLNGGLPSMSEKWRRSLLKIGKLPKEEAILALLDMPDVFSSANRVDEAAIIIEVMLFEFTEIGERVLHPAILFRGP